MKQKSFDKDRFHKLITRHQQQKLTSTSIFTQQRRQQKIKAHSFIVGRSISSISSINTEKDKQKEKERHDNESLQSKHAPSLTKQMQSKRIIRHRSSLQPATNTNTNRNGTGTGTGTGTEKGTCLHRNLGLTSMDRKSSISQSSTSFLQKANPHARLALVELATRYKYNQFSPAGVTITDTLNDNDALNDGFSELPPLLGLDHDHDNDYDYSFDLMTAAESETETDDEVSTAMLTASLDIDIDIDIEESMYDDDEGPSTLSLVNRVIRVNIVTNTNPRTSTNAAIADTVEEEEEKYPKYQQEWNSNLDDDDDGGDGNVDYLVQLRTLIGKVRTISLSEEDVGVPVGIGTEAFHPSSPSKEDRSRPVELECESYHSSVDEHDCMDLATEENDNTSVLSPLTYEYTYTQLSDIKGVGSGPGQGHFHTKCTMFRWCALLWFFSLLLVYERCLSNEIYVISQRRRTMELTFLHHVSRFRTVMDDFMVQDKDYYAYVYDDNDSDERFDAELRSSISAVKKSVENGNLLEAEHPNLDVLDADQEHEILFVFIEHTHIGIELHPCSDALEQYFYHDMTTCNDNAVVGESVALEVYFYRDITTCNDALDVSAALDIYFHRDMMVQFFYAFDVVPALEHYFYRDMMACFDISSKEQHESLPTLSTESFSTTSDLEFLFYFDMSTSIPSSVDDKPFCRGMKSVGTTDAVDFMFYRDMTSERIESSAPFPSDNNWSERSLENIAIPVPPLSSAIDNTRIRHSECFFAFLGRISMIDEAPELCCQYFMPPRSVASNKTPLEYLHSPHQAVDADVPVIDLILDFFRVIRQSWKHKRQNRKKKKRHSKLARIKRVKLAK